MRLLLARHAETESNIVRAGEGQLPGVLSARGRQQALALAKRLAGQSIDVCYCSDLARAVDTLSALLKLTPGLSISYSPELRERSMGVLEGMSGQAYKEFMETGGYSRVSHRPDKGESLEDVRIRSGKFLEMLRREHLMKKPRRTILIMTHGGVITTLLAELLGESIESRLLHQPNNTALSEVVIEEGQVVTNYLNCTAHLV